MLLEPKTRVSPGRPELANDGGGTNRRRYSAGAGPISRRKMLPHHHTRLKADMCGDCSTPRSVSSNRLRAARIRCWVSHFAFDSYAELEQRDWFKQDHADRGQRHPEMLMAEPGETEFLSIFFSRCLRELRHMPPMRRRADRPKRWWWRWIRAAPGTWCVHRG